MKAFTLIATAAALTVTSADEYFTGDGTAYTLGQTSAGNCNMMSALDFATTDYAALNNEQWDGLQNCGRCAEVSCADDRCADQSTSIVVQILDRCPECKHGDLDLSPTVFTALTGSTPSRYTMKWKFVDCPVSGNVNYCLKGGSNNFWTAVQPTNYATGVQSLQINGQDTTMLGSAFYYVLDGASQTQTDLTSVTISMTDVNGNSIEDTVSLTADSCTEGANQFPSGGSTSQTSQQSTPTTKNPTTKNPTPTTAAPTTAPTTAPPTQAPTTAAPTPTPTPTETPAPTTQTPSPTTVRPATSAPVTTAPPSQQQESLPTTVPVSTTATPTTAPPSTTAPVATVAPSTTAPQTPAPQTPAPQTPAPQTPALQTTAPSTTAPQTTAPSTPPPVTTSPESSTTQDTKTASGSDAGQQLFNVTGTVEPETTTAPKKASKTSGKTTGTSSTTADDGYTHQQEQTQKTTEVPAATTAAPSTEQTEDSQAADDAQTVTTKSKESSNGTDPLVIVLSTLGAVGMVALIVVVVKAKRKNLQEEKGRDMEAPSMMSVQSFDVQNTPSDRRQGLAGIL